jgi:hypothetical protein
MLLGFTEKSLHIMIPQNLEVQGGGGSEGALKS